MRIADFHCDLLAYLAGDAKRNLENPESRASIPQLRKGNIVLQAMAVFTVTGPDSIQKGEAQIAAFERLKQEPFFQKEVYPLLTIENASGFCGEDEPLDKGLRRVEKWLNSAGSIGYIS